MLKMSTIDQKARWDVCVSRW